MSCFNNGCTSPDFMQKCCSPAKMCEFDGNLKKVCAEPIFVQKVFDAALFNLQGMKSISGQQFSPAVPVGYRLKKVVDIRCKKYFNPEDINDPRNLTVTADVTISGGSFLEDGRGNHITVIGPDGTASEKIIYADTSECDEKDKGTPIFGTQNIKIFGDVHVEIDVLASDPNDRDCIFTLSANVPIAAPCAPLVLTNFFELCLPSVFDSAFLPRFAEFCNVLCETRLATNNIGRDISLNPDTGHVCANLIIALCVSCEKKIVVPVQLCVLSTGYTQLTPSASTICNAFPQLFPTQLAPNRCPADDVCGIAEEEVSGNNDCCCTPPENHCHDHRGHNVRKCDTDKA